jgi:hypothetical protein
VNDALFRLSRFPVEFHNGSTLSWDELKPRHLIVSEEWEADIMAALAEFPGSGTDGGRGRDNVRVKRRVVIDVSIGPWQPRLLQKHALHDAPVQQPSESAAIVMRGVRQFTQSS